MFDLHKKPLTRIRVRGAVRVGPPRATRWRSLSRAAARSVRTDGIMVAGNGMLVQEGQEV